MSLISLIWPIWTAKSYRKQHEIRFLQILQRIFLHFSQKLGIHKPYFYMSLCVCVCVQRFTTNTLVPTSTEREEVCRHFQCLSKNCSFEISFWMIFQENFCLCLFQMHTGYIHWNTTLRKDKSDGFIFSEMSKLWKALYV